MVEAGRGRRRSSTGPAALGAGLLADVVRDAAELPAEERAELRDLANDLCLKTDGRSRRTTSRP